MCGFQVIDLITTYADKKFEPAGHMAAAIIQITQEYGDCLPHELSPRGFATDEIEKHWHMAQSLAAVELKLMDGQALQGCTVKEMGYV